MGILVGTFIFVAITCLWIYLFLSISYAIHESYPLVGHIFSFVHDRKAFSIHCQQRYGQCFNQRCTFLLSPSDWTTIMRSSAFYFPANQVALNVFDTSVDYFSRYQYLLRLELVNRMLKVIDNTSNT